MCHLRGAHHPVLVEVWAEVAKTMGQLDKGPSYHDLSSSVLLC
jgi:hypothetical protein